MGESRYVGIDVAKGSMEVGVYGDKESWSFSNDENGLNKLITKMKRLAPSLIVMETTGGCESAIAAELCSKGFPVAIVNPHHISDFARSVEILAETDVLNA